MTSGTTQNKMAAGGAGRYNGKEEEVIIKNQMGKLRRG